MQSDLNQALPHISQASLAKWSARGWRFLQTVFYIVKTTTPKQRPHLFSAVWFFVCAWLAIKIYAIDPDMTLWNVIGYSIAASLIYGVLGACFGNTILEMPMDDMRLFKAGSLGALCGVLFTLIVIFIVPMYLLLTHALPMPSTPETEQLLLFYGVVVPFAFVGLPAIVVGIITTVSLRIFHYRLISRPQANTELPD